MSHDVYISYDSNDLEIANKVCSVLEKNSLSCWIKSRDVGVNDIIDDGRQYTINKYTLNNTPGLDVFGNISFGTK